MREKTPPVLTVMKLYHQTYNQQNATEQNQYREYLGVPTAGKKFGDIFDISEVTDEIREQYSNKYFPKEIL